MMDSSADLPGIRFLSVPTQGNSGLSPLVLSISGQMLPSSEQVSSHVHCIQHVLYYPCCENKGTIRVAKTKALISCAVTAQLICAFVFA